ncbi:phosphotransferase [Streptomyces alfalfae]
MRALDAAVHNALRQLRPPGIKLALPTPVGGTLHYHALPGAETVAKASVEPGCTLSPVNVAAALLGAGEALRLLHATMPTTDVGRRIPGPTRLAAWMRDGQGPRSAPALHPIMLRYLGGARWDRALAWCAALDEPSPGEVFLHGAPSLGSIVVGRKPSRAALLMGEDITRGPADFDLGWLLGEFVEWRMVLDHPVRGRRMDQELYRATVAALLDGYGPQDDPQTAGRAAVLRLLTHVHDFAAYVGWHPELLDYVAKIAELIDCEGASALSVS